MVVEPLLGPIIKRRYMSCAPPPLRREPRMGTVGSAAGGTSILNSQISILSFSPPPLRREPRMGSVGIASG